MSNLLFLIVLFGFYLDNYKGYGSTINVSITTSSAVPLNTTYKTEPITTSACTEQVVSYEWKKEDFPNPQTDVTRCGRNCQKSWICDPNKVITNNFYLNRIETTLARIRRNGFCGCLNCTGIGYKMSVALVNRIRFESWETVSSDGKKKKAQEFASFLRSKSWHPGGTCADDIVIFVSRGDRQVQTAVGPRATAALSASCLQYVYSQVKSELTSGYFGKAVDEMTILYEQAILTGRCQSSNNLSQGAVIAVIMVCFVVFVGLFISIFFCVRSGGCGKCEVTYYGSHYHNGYPFHHNRHRGGRHSGGGGGGGFSSFGVGDGGGGGGGSF